MRQSFRGRLRYSKTVEILVLGFVLATSIKGRGYRPGLKLKTISVLYFYQLTYKVRILVVLRKGTGDSKGCRDQDRSRSGHGNDQTFDNEQPACGEMYTPFGLFCRRAVDVSL